jgi:hypothetical protein
MTVKEKLQQLQSRPACVDKNIPGIGTVRILRLRTNEAAEILKNATRASFALAAAAVCETDDKNTRVFANEDELATMEWSVTNAILTACNEVNAIDIEAAAGN